MEDYLVAQFLDAHQGSGTVLNASFASFLPATLLSVAKFTMQVLSVILFALTAVVIWKIRKLWPGPRPFERMSENLRAAPVVQSQSSKQWEKIKARLEQPSEAEWKIAVIEADKLVDDLLRRMGYLGTSMGERLKTITSAQLISIEALWAAHKMRNLIVHDPDARMLYRDAREAIANYEAFLKEAQVIE